MRRASLICSALIVVSWLGARAVAQTAPPSAAGSDAGAVATCLERALAAFAAKDQTALSDLLCGVLAHGAGPGSDVIAEWSPRWPPPGPDLKAAKITVCGDMAYAVLEAPPPLGRAAPEDALDRCSLVVVLVRSGDAWRIAGMSSILSTTDPATLPPGTRELWVRGHELLRYDIHNMVRKLADVGWDVIADSHFVAVPDSRHGGLEVVTAQALMARLQAEMDSRHSLRADIPSMTLPDKREEFSIVGLSSAFFTARVLMHGADGSTSPVQWAMLLDWPTDHPIWEGRLVVFAPLPDKRAQGPTQ